MKCYFNSCPLNEDYYLKQYKKANPEIKQLFLTLDQNDEIIKSSKLISNSKKYHFCIEHILNLKLFKIVKEKLELIAASSPISNQLEFRTTLEQLNALISYDDNMKSLCFKIDKIDPVSLIISQLTKSDRTIDMLLLLNLRHFLKEITYAKKYSTNDLYLAITGYYFNYIYSPYESIPQFTLDEKERLIREAIVYGLILDNIRYIIVNAKAKGLRLDITTKVTVKALEVITCIITHQRSNDNKGNSDYLGCLSVMEKMTTSNSIMFVYAVFTSKNSQIDLNTSIVNVLCKFSKELFDYIKQANDSSLRKEYIILLNELLYNIIHIHCDQLEINNVQGFIKESESLMALEENGLIESKIRSNIIAIKEKIAIHSSGGFNKIIK